MIRLIADILNLTWQDNDLSYHFFSFTNQPRIIIVIIICQLLQIIIDFNNNQHYQNIPKLISAHFQSIFFSSFLFHSLTQI